MVFSTIFSKFWHKGEQLLMIVSYIFAGIYYTSVLCCLTLTSEHTYTKLQDLTKQLENIIVHSKQMDFKDGEKIKFLIKEVENTKPLNGNGYFDLNKGTLTSIVSISLTYFIILIQFRNPGKEI